MNIEIFVVCPNCKGGKKDIFSKGQFHIKVDCLTCNGTGEILLKRSEYPDSNDWGRKDLHNGDFEIVTIKK